MEFKKKIYQQIKEHNTKDELIRSFLYQIADNTLNDKSDRDAKNELIDQLFRDGFELHDPTGTKKIGSKVLQQALWRVMSKVKFLNFAIHGTGQPEEIERLVTEGVATVCERGGMTTCFRDKGGVFQGAFMHGDRFLMFGEGDGRDSPLAFTVVRGEDVYPDNFAYGIRGVKPCNKLVVIHSYGKEEAYELWPELEANDVWGKLPGSYRNGDEEEEQNDNDIVEVAWGFNLASKTKVVFAGTQAFEIERFEGKEYPHIKRGKPYIPVFQFLCQPSDDQFWNYGVFDMIYDLAVITKKLMNMEVAHIEENVYPITLINAPATKVDELVEKMTMANKAKANGGTPFVAMEFGQGSGSVAAQSLLTQNLTNEWKMVWDVLYREISRLGINLDDADRGSGYTRGQVIAEEESANAFIKQMMEYNASETQELIECVMDGITEYVSVKNKSPLNLMTRIRLPEGSTEKIGVEITLGMLSKTLKEGNWFCRTDSRTGAITSDLMRMIKLESQLQLTPPGTPEYQELYRKVADIRGLEMGEATPPLQSGGGPAPSVPEPGQEAVPAAAETQRTLPGKTAYTLSAPV